MMETRLLLLLVAIGEALSCPICNGIGWTAKPSRTVPDWQPGICECRTYIKELCEQTRKEGIP